MRKYFLFGVFLCFSALNAFANEHIGDFGDWHVYRYQDSGQTVCHAWSRPIKEEGKYTKRGEVYGFITNRPAEKIKHEVSFAMGYPVKNVLSKVNIDNASSFKFFSYDEAIFLNESRAREMSNKMQRGNRMYVYSVSARGTKTKDTYSLKGVTKAMQALDKACNQ